MALIKCPECGKEISDKSEVCIHCGYPIAKYGFEKEENNCNALEEKESPVISEEDISEESLRDLNFGESMHKHSKKKIIFIVCGLAVLLAVAAFFVCRFFFFPREVSDMETSIIINGIEYSGTFSGKVKYQTPCDKGKYTFGEGELVWYADGVVNENGSISGSVVDMPVSVDAGSGVIDAKYSGIVENGMLMEPVNVLQLPFKVEYDGIPFVGNYDGELLNNHPDGTGEYSGASTDGKYYISYSGNWNNGTFSNEGNLSTNHLTIHFSDIDRTGTYEGAVLNGVPEGEGMYSATNNDNIDYTYTGDFKAGLFDGQGRTVYDSDDYCTHIGTYVKGDFVPTVDEFLVSYATDPDAQFGITDEKREFIKSNSELFTKNDYDAVLQFVDPNFDINLFTKNPGADETKMIEFTLSPFQVVEQNNYWGRDYTYFLAQKNGVCYYCFFLGKSEKIIEDKKTTFCGIPIDYATYTTVGNTKNWAAFILVSCVE